MLEIEAARSAFAQLGAEPDARRAAELLAPADSDAGVRATKALMFTDIVGSTNLIGTIGDDSWVYLVRWHDRLLRSLFDDHGGREVDHAGDGFFVAFTDSDAAIRCACEIQRRLAEHRIEHGFAPDVCIGIHCAVVTEVKGEHTGVEVHKAARVADLAGAGEILATTDAADGLPARQISDPRTVALKGIAEPVEIVAVDWH